MPKQPDSLQGNLEFLVLKTLETDSQHGFGITQYIQTASDGLLRLEEGSLYPALHRMEKVRLIKGEWKVTKNGRRARYYKLTAAGRKRLLEVHEQWETLSKGIGKILRFA